MLNLQRIWGNKTLLLFLSNRLISVPRVPPRRGIVRYKPSFHSWEPKPEGVCRPHHRRWGYSCLCVCKCVFFVWYAISHIFLNECHAHKAQIASLSPPHTHTVCLWERPDNHFKRVCGYKNKRWDHLILFPLQNLPLIIIYIIFLCHVCVVGNLSFCSTESRHEVPAVMTSLWKKLDFTLNQIK